MGQNTEDSLLDPVNLRLIGELLRSIDKERAEVVMDVNIYEVSRDDLMQLGNQIGTGDSLLNLGGIQKGLSVMGGSRQVVTQALSSVPTALGAAFLVPPTTLSALQRKDSTRLVASKSMRPPKLLLPRPTTDTSSAELPSLRLSIAGLSLTARA